jgi:hypothetical protein
MSESVNITVIQKHQGTVSMSEILRYMKKNHWQENGRGQLISPKKCVELSIVSGEQMLINGLSDYEKRSSYDVFLSIKESS